MALFYCGGPVCSAADPSVSVLWCFVMDYGESGCAAAVLGPGEKTGSGLDCICSWPGSGCVKMGVV